MNKLDPPVLVTGDIILRKPTDADVPAIVRGCNDPLTLEWLSLLPRPYTEERAREYVHDHAVQVTESGQGLERAIEVDGAFAGVIGLKNTDWATRHTEVGYWLGPWARGRGVMTRALCCLVDWLFAEAGMRRVEIQVEPGNVASLAVAERAGFRQEGLLRHRGGVRNGRPVDLLMLSKLVGDSPATGSAHG